MEYFESVYSPSAMEMERASPAEPAARLGAYIGQTDFPYSLHPKGPLPIIHKGLPNSHIEGDYGSDNLIQPIWI